MTHATLKGATILRFVVCASRTNSDDVQYSWKFIQDVAAEFIAEEKVRAKLAAASLANYIQ